MFNPNIIKLKGGFNDGRVVQVTDDIVHFGLFRTARIQTPTYNNYALNADRRFLEIQSVPVEVDEYIRTKVTAGEPNTCEYREWYEWILKK